MPLSHMAISRSNLTTGRPLGDVCGRDGLPFRHRLSTGVCDSRGVRGGRFADALRLPLGGPGVSECGRPSASYAPFPSTGRPVTGSRLRLGRRRSSRGMARVLRRRVVWSPRGIRRSRGSASRISFCGASAIFGLRRTSGRLAPWGKRMSRTRPHAASVAPRGGFARVPPRRRREGRSRLLGSASLPSRHAACRPSPAREHRRSSAELRTRSRPAGFEPATSRLSAEK